MVPSQCSVSGPKIASPRHATGWPQATKVSEVLKSRLFIGGTHAFLVAFLELFSECGMRKEGVRMLQRCSVAGSYRVIVHTLVYRLARNNAEA